MKNELQIIQNHKPIHTEEKEDIYTTSEKAFKLKILEKQSLNIRSSHYLLLLILTITLIVLYNSISKGVFKSSDPLLIFMSTLLPLIGLLAITNMIRIDLHALQNIEVFKSQNPYLYSKSEDELLKILNLKLKETSYTKHLVTGELKVTLNAQSQTYQLVDIKNNLLKLEVIDETEDDFKIKCIDSDLEFNIDKKQAIKVKNEINQLEGILKLKFHTYAHYTNYDLEEEIVAEAFYISNQLGQRVIQ